MTSSPSSPSAIFTRATIALANSQRLISSWLPPTPASTTTSTLSDREREEQEEEMFVAMPEVLGVGATLPKDKDVKREELSSNERLRRQLLGRDYKKVRDGKGDRGLLGGFTVVGSKPRPVAFKRDNTEDSGDEGGRSSLGTSKRKRREEQAEPGAGISDEEVTRLAKASMGTSRPQKRAVNYLDQILAEKSRRQRKKRRKHDSES